MSPKKPKPKTRELSVVSKGARASQWEKPKMTRRTAIQATATAGLALVASQVLLSEPTKFANQTAVIRVPKADRQLLDLEKHWFELEEAHRRNSAAYRGAEDKLPAWAKAGEDNHGKYSGWPELDRQHPAFQSLDRMEWMHFTTRPNLPKLRRYNRSKLTPWTLGSDEYEAEKRAGRARVRAWIVRRREQMVARDRCGVNRLERQNEEQCDQSLELGYRILETPAESIEGLAVKIRAMVRWNDDHDAFLDITDYRAPGVTLDTAYHSSILRDSERLARGAS